LLTVHRAFEPATPLGKMLGLDVGVEVSLMKVTDDLASALKEVGAELPIAVLPIPRLHLHKGLGDRAEVGFSAVKYQNYRIYGGDFKLAVAMPDEGPTWAIRLNYTDAQMEWVRSRTWTPEVLVSRKLDFADPYLGMGYSFVTGRVDYTLTFEGVPLYTKRYDGSGSAFTAFTGVQFKAPGIGLRLVLEGSYNAAGAHGLGVNAGFGF
jgi:hypothetical protein